MLPAADPGGRRVALVLATGEYDDPDIGDLAAPAQDAEDMTEVLCDPGLGEFSVVTLVDRPGREVSRAIEDFLADRLIGDLALIYLSGHGLLDGQGQLYFLLRDTAPGRLDSTAIAAEWLLKVLDKSAARSQVLILDCCWSGAFAGTGLKAAEIDIERFFRASGRGRVVLTASRAGQYAHEHPAHNGSGIVRSVFTEALVDGIRSGDADVDQDGVVSTQDAHSYTTSRLRATGATQNPQQWLYSGEGQIALARSPRGLPNPAAMIPANLRISLESPHSAIRRTAVAKLEPLLNSDQPTQALAARQLLVSATKDVPEVAEVAREMLREPEPEPEPRTPASPGAVKPLWSFLRRQTRPRRTVIAGGVVLALGTVLWAGNPVPGPPGDPNAGDPPAAAGPQPSTGWQESTASTPSAVLSACTDPKPVTVRVFASQEKAGLLAGLAADYGKRSAAGTCLKVDVQARSFGRLLDQLVNSELTGDEKPDVLSPASSRWFSRTYYRAQQNGRTGQLPPLPQQWEAVVNSPVVIAMPEPMARALGWPNVHIGWRELAALAKDPLGWGAKSAGGHSGWGPFRLGKTNPLYSTSGLIATVGSTYAFTAHAGDNRELTLDDVNDPDTQQQIKEFEKSVVHYGENTLKFLSGLRTATDQAKDTDQGLQYISAVAVEESSMIAYNRGYPCGAVVVGDKTCARRTPPKVRLVAVYPADGTLLSDHPYLKMAGLSPAKNQVAEDFLRFVRSERSWPKISSAGFRSDAGRTPDDATDGALPARVTTLPEPAPQVLDRVMEVWPTLRKPANVLLVIDTSDSMTGGAGGKDTKIGLVREAGPGIVSGFGDHDHVGLWTFAGKRLEAIPANPMTATQRAGLTDAFVGLRAGGKTCLYNTIDAAVGSVRASWDPGAINAVIVLSDGRNDAAPTIDLDTLLGRIQPGVRPVRVYTIAYGRDADPGDKDGQSTLKRIAEATGGVRYSAPDPQSIKNVFIDIMSNF